MSPAPVEAFGRVILSTPTPIRGRVMGIWAMALPGSTVVTGVLVGALAQLTDPRLAYAVVGGVTVIVAALSWRALGRHDENGEGISGRAA